jgi:class 3 adenylate cyclase
MSLQRQLEASIAALEAQRSILGDETVDAALGPLRARLRDLESMAAPAGERELKQVTILFLDVVGSTELGQQFDPEDVHVILGEALKRFSNAIEEQGGRVLKHVGDGLMAAFGVDIADEFDPKRAVRAGLAALAEAKRYRETVRASHGVSDFRVRVGVNTGDVLLSRGAAPDVHGDAVNIAARMEKTAPVDGLRIGEATYRQTRGLFDVVEDAPQRIKGVTEPVRSYLVLGERPRALRTIVRGVEGVETPLVGRDTELAQLKQAFGALASGDAPAPVTIIAEPGVGKSRLLNEFVNWVDTRPERCQLFRGRAQPQSVDRPFSLLRDILAWRFEIADSDSTATARDKLERALLALFDGEVQKVELIAQLLGFDPPQNRRARAARSNQMVRERAFEAAGDVFARASKMRGESAVVVLDDMHWADDGSLDFFSGLASAPLLLITAARPELDRRRPGWPAPGHVRIDLRALDSGASDELARALLSKLENAPPALRQQLARTSDGNPFFMEETVKMLIDEGAITVAGDKWRVAQERLDTMKAPTTIVGVLQARLAGLSPAERATLQQASVIGHEFWDTALAAVSGGEAEHLDALLRRELVFRHPESAIEGARQYSFKHHVLRQVVYDSFLKRAKREAHRRAGEWFADLSGRRGEFLGVTAMHYENASEHRLAMSYARRAGEHACRATAYADAARLFQMAIDCARKSEGVDAAESIEMNLALADAQRRGGDTLGAMATALQAAEAARATGSPQMFADAALAYEAARWRPGLPSEPSIALLNEALGRLPETDSPDRSRLLFNLARAYGFTTEHAKAVELGRAGVDMARRLGDDDLLCDGLEHAAMAMLKSPEALEERLAMNREQLALARRLGNESGATIAYECMGINLVYLGDAAAYDEMASQFQEQARRLGQPHHAYVAALGKAMRALLRGEFSEAPVLAREAFAVGSRIGGSDAEGVYALQMFTLHRELGKLNAVAPVLKLLESEGNMSFWGPGLALLYAEIGDAVAASQLLKRLAADDFATVPRDDLWLTSSAFIADACALAEEAEIAESVRPMLLDWSGQNVVCGPNAVCYGPVDRLLGVLDRTMGNWRRGSEHFEAAMELAKRLHSDPVHIRTACDYADLLLREGTEAAKHRCAGVLRDIEADAARLGMAGLAARAADLGARLGDVSRRLN